MENSIDSTTISDLLHNKFSEKFVCIPECKVGSAWVMNKCSVIDFWCMAKSWTNPRTIAFEIKVSRQDFLRDNKWPEYLKYCTEFYFVAPPRIIDPSEVPEQAGLMVCSKNAKLLYTKKKAPYRNVDIPDSIYRYILMWRTKVTDENQNNRDATNYWKSWLAQKDEKKELGYNVSKKIRELVKSRIFDVETRNILLKDENEKLEELKAFLKELGFESFNYFGIKSRIEQRVKEIKTGFPSDLERSLETAISHLEFVKKTIF